jgi:hypothetical protein
VYSADIEHRIFELLGHLIAVDSAEIELRIFELLGHLISVDKTRETKAFLEGKLKVEGIGKVQTEINGRNRELRVYTRIDVDEWESKCM